MQPFQVFLEQMAQLVGGYVPNLIAALVILVVGWLVALILSAIVRGALRRTTLDNRLARWIMGGEAVTTIDVEHWASRLSPSRSTSS